MNEFITVRVAGRCKLTVEANELYETSKNKSAFISDAINFYVEFGEKIVNQNNSVEQKLDEILSKLDNMDNLKVVVQESVENNDMQFEETKSEVPKEITKEEKEQQESIQHTLANFMNFDF